MKKYNIDIDSSDLDALHKFFDDHSDYTFLELSFKFGIPISTLRYWRREKLGVAGIPNALTKLKTIRKPKHYDTVSPEIWDNGPWFKKMYEEDNHGAYVISKMINRSVRVVYKRLKRFQIPLRDHGEATRTRNPYHNREWLMDRYIYNGLPLSVLAKEASVNLNTILYWLAQFNIRIRDGGASTVIRGIKNRVEKSRLKNGTSIPKTTEDIGRKSIS